MPKILISYRRVDTAGVAGRVFDRLVTHYGADSIFMDIDNIPLGVDFREHVANVFSHGDILLALIGPQWAGSGPDGRRRIDQPNDMVRIEVESALKRNIPVIPVLVDHTPMPQPAELPGALEALAYRNAAELDTFRDFHPHMDRLIRAMDRLVTPPPAAAIVRSEAPSRPANVVPPPVGPPSPEKPAATGSPPVQPRESSASPAGVPPSPPPTSPGPTKPMATPLSATPAAASIAIPAAPAGLWPILRWALLAVLAGLIVQKFCYLVGMTFRDFNLLMAGYYFSMLPWIPAAIVLFFLWWFLAKRNGTPAVPKTGKALPLVALALFAIGQVIYGTFALGVGSVWGTGSAILMFKAATDLAWAAIAGVLIWRTTARAPTP